MAWGRMLSVLAAALLLSGWIAVSGPGSARARLRQAERMKADARRPVTPRSPASD